MSQDLTYLPRFAIDQFTLDPLQRLIANLATLVPDPRLGARRGAKVPLRDLLRADIVKEAVRIVTAYAPLTDVSDRRRHHRREMEEIELVRNETWALTAEFAYLLSAALARYPDLRNRIRPRIGATPDQRVANLQDMRALLDRFEADLKAARVELLLLPRHSREAIAKQVQADKAAAARHRELVQSLELDEKDRLQLRAEAQALQPLINNNLRAALGEDRETLMRFGFEERTFESTRARSRTSSKGESKDEQKEQGKGSDASENETQAQEKPSTSDARQDPASLDIHPPPGMVARGEGLPPLPDSDLPDFEPPPFRGPMPPSSDQFR